MVNIDIYQFGLALCIPPPKNHAGMAESAGPVGEVPRMRAGCFLRGYSAAIAAAVSPQVLEVSNVPEASVRTREMASAFMQLPFTIASDTACMRVPNTPKRQCGHGTVYEAKPPHE